jgi:hypothetical protein
MKVARNAPCPCGSGKKSKVCCGAREKMTQSTSNRIGLVLLAVALLAGLVLSVFNLLTDGERSAEHAGSAAQGGAGRVWSAEHGHYHDAP